MSKFNEIAAEMGTLVTAKNLAYGDSFAKCGEFLRLLYPAGIQPEQYTDALAMVRIFDKQMRIATRKDAFGESPYRDIIGYGILGAAQDTPSPAVSPPPAEVATAGEETRGVYTFPCAEKFIGMLRSEYIGKIREETNEAATALSGEGVITELFDVIHAAETAIRSLCLDWDLDPLVIRDAVVSKNAKRKYYDKP